MTYKERKEKIEKKYKDIISDLKKGRCTKEELSVKYDLDERTIRRIIAEISCYFPVISFSSAKGYYNLYPRWKFKYKRNFRGFTTYSK